MVLLLICAAGAQAAFPRGEFLYLLAGTPTEDYTFALPVVLYSVGPGRQLRVVRQVDDSLFDVRDDLAGNLYVLNAGPSALDVIHEDRPAVPDRISATSASEASANGAFRFYFADWGVAAGPGLAPRVLLPLLLGKTRDAPTWNIASILGIAAAGSKRVSVDHSWSAYKDFRYAGPGGGPYPYVVPGLNLEGDELTVPALLSGKGLFDLQRLPPSIAARAGGASGAALIADTPLVFAFASGSRTLGAALSVHVVDRASGKWSEPADPVFSVRPRTFGRWLAFVVQKPANGRASPGLENERSVFYGHGASPISRPNIRGEYPADLYMPGEIDLFNVQDGRKVAVRTGQQDSEVLDVSDSGAVLYRVNNAIFSAQIKGDHLGPATQVVQGDDVPEVHWAFWSSAPPPAQSSAPEK